MATTYIILTVLDEVPYEFISECLSANKTLNLTVGWKTTHVIYSRMNNVSQKNSEVNVSTASSSYAGHDGYTTEGDVQECRLQVTSEEIQLVHVMFVEQTCTPKNKIVVQGKRKSLDGNTSKLSTGIEVAIRKIRYTLLSHKENFYKAF